MSASPSTPLDYVAEGYWQDFLAERPIAGGIAYEGQLHACQLDETLGSLQRLDTLISQIRRDIAKSDVLEEDTLLTDDRYRNLLLFLAFYAGRVLAKQWNRLPHWYGQFELRKHYFNKHCSNKQHSKLPLVIEDFYQQMAVSYHDDSDVTFDGDIFFALEPIGLRLFGHIDRPFEAVQGGHIASGLYQAVSARLPNSSDNQTSPVAVVSENIKTDSNISSQMKQAVISKDKIENDHDLLNHEIQTEPELPENSASSAKTTITPSSKSLPTPEIFTQLLAELDEIEVIQNVGNDDYQQACKTLDQFERHIARQHKPRAQVLFSDFHQQARQQGLINLKRAATDGHTAAMLRLAMYELLGEGLSIYSTTNDEKTAKEVNEVSGIDWVKKAANYKDSRAQRLLSKMYYQGVGVSQDMDSGKYWLEQAAENGHAEAIQIVAQWQQAQRLITTKKEEQHSIKRYQLLIAAIAIGALLLLIFV